MRKLAFLFCVLYCFLACSEITPVGDLPVIDVVNSIGKYQKVYCSDFFSSIELIPLETSSECLVSVAGQNRTKFILNDDFILINQLGENLYSFDRKGKFLHQIGRKGQGPGEYLVLSGYFVDTDKPSIYIQNLSRNILEYDFNGKYIRSFPIPEPDGISISDCSYAGDNLFVGHQTNYGKSKYNFCLFDRNGDTVKCFPNHYFFERVGGGVTFADGALRPFRVDGQIYLKNYVNDTIFTLEELALQPAYVYGLGKYTLNKEYLLDVKENIRNGGQLLKKLLRIDFIIGSPKYFFYTVGVSELFPRPKTKPVITIHGSISRDGTVFGIYDIESNTNVLLDTNEHFEGGIINDLNGGLSFFPKYYFAGENVVVDYWDPEEMKEMLTEEFFATKTIKDPLAHEKLKEILKNLKEDDNPVMVIAKLK